MKKLFSCTVILAAFFCLTSAAVDMERGESPALGLPPVPYPEDNPQTPQKIALGEKLFNDQRFSSTGDVSCATCHDAQKAFTDSPLKVSEGINKLTGTRNAPTVINSAYFETSFWDGRSPSLEDQALHPFVNPVEMGLKGYPFSFDYSKRREAEDLKPAGVREITAAPSGEAVYTTEFLDKLCSGS